jgi:hypothetical protein
MFMLIFGVGFVLGLFFIRLTAVLLAQAVVIQGIVLVLGVGFELALNWL